MAQIADSTLLVLPSRSALLDLFGAGSADTANWAWLLSSFGGSLIKPGGLNRVLPGLGGFLVKDESFLNRVDVPIQVFRNVLRDVSLGKPVDDSIPVAGRNAWHLEAIGVRPNNGFGAGVLIGVIDSGVDTTHPELNGGQCSAFVSIDQQGKCSFPAPFDRQTHGTHICGILVGAETGVATAAKVAVANVLPDGGSTASTTQLATAVDWLIQRRVDVINFSMGCNCIADDYVEVFQRAVSANIPVVAASGNDGIEGGDDSPAHFDFVVSVGATRWANGCQEIWHGTDWRLTANGPARAPKPDICAPGASVWSCKSGGGHVWIEGTSQATAVVTGVYAGWLANDRAVKGPDGLFAELERRAQPYHGRYAERSRLGLLHC